MSTKIGGIYVEVRADKTQFQKDLTAIRGEAKKASTDIGKALDDGITGNRAKNGIANISTGLLQLSKSASVTDSSFKTTASSISKGLSDVASQVGMTSKEFASLNEKMLRNQAYQQAQTALKGIASAAGLSAKETKNMAQQMGYSATQATEMANKIHKVRDAGNATMTMFSKFATAAAVAFATHELINFAKQIKDVGVAFDSLNRSYEAIMGSQRLADAEMQFVNETAKKLGLNLVSLEDSYKGLLAASKGTTLEGANTRDLFIAVAKASSVLGMSADDTTGSLRAFIQMISKGTVQSEELRGQLGERLYGAFNLAAKAMGTTTEDLNKMLQRGDVLATDLIPKLANVLEGDYSAAAEKAGESSRAAFENFNTAVLELKRTLGESGIIEFLANVTRNATQMINTVREAIGSINTEKAKTSLSEYDAALGEANDKFAQFKSLWGNTRGLVPENLKSQFDKLSGAVETLETARDKLAKGLQNEQGMVSTFGKAASEASKASTELEEKLRKQYAKTTDYRLAEAKKELASYVKIEGAKPEYVAMLKDEIASLEKKANATSIAGHKSLTASHNKELEEQVRAFEQAKEEQKRAHERFDDDHKKATLSTFEYEVEKLDEKYEYYKAQKVDALRLEEWYAEQYFELYNEDVERYVAAQEAKASAVDKSLDAFFSDLDNLHEEEVKKQVEAMEAQQDAYDELYDGIYGFTRDVIDDWDDMGNTLVDMAESMVKDIIAAFVTQKIAIPVYMEFAEMAGISTGLASGMSPSSGGLASMTSPISSLFTIGKTAYTLVTEGVSAAVSDLVGADLLGSISSAMFGKTASTILGETVATTFMPTYTSIYPAVEYAATEGFSDLALAGIESEGFSDLALAGIESGKGIAPTTGAGIGGAAGPIGLAVAAFMAIDTFLGSHDQADPDIYVQSPSGGLTESTATYTVSNRDAVTDEIVTIFDAAFASLDESLDANIVDAVTASAFRGKIRVTDLDETDPNALINSLVESAFSGNYTGSIASFEGLFGAGSVTGYTSVKVDGEYVDYWNNILTPLTEAVSGQYSKGLSDILMEAIGLDSGIFDFDFLKSLQAEGENLFDTFANFAIVVQETDGFVENITRQMNEFGFTVEEAFTNILVVLSVLDEIQASVDALATTSSVAALNTLTESWYALIESLEAAYATTTQITEAETAMAQVLGANITGLTADALQSALSGGGDIESILQTSIQNAAYADIAQKIADGYITGINEQIGQVWIDTGGDLEAVAEAMQDIDTIEAQDALEELQESFGLLSEYAVDATSDLSEASRIISLAINGQLSAAQQFAEWQIENAAALSLYTEMTAASVTKKELEGAIDAFVDLGLAGDDLSTVIQELADRFTETTQQMYENISDIESAQGDLMGSEESTEAYLNSMKAVVDFFKDTPSMSQIRGDESVTTSVFDEDGYQEAIANYVVKSEFKNILGRSPASNFYQNKVLEGSLSLNDIHNAIVNGISNSEDRVNEIFNRLFGRSASSSYWADALEDGLVSLSKLESSILAGASEKDLAYYKSNAGKVEITNWGDFESAAKLAGIDEEDYYKDVTKTMSGDFSTSEKEVSAALDQLEALPDVIDSSGNLISSALDEFIDVVGNMSAAVLEDIFGSEASSQIQAMVSAIDDYESSMSSASGSTSKTSDAVEELTEYLDEYLEYLQTEMDLRQEAFDDAKNILQDYIDGEEALIEARKAAAASIDEYINSLKSSSYSPVQSLEFFEKRYAQLLSDAQNADAEGVTEAISSLTSFTSEYLDFAGAYGGQDYNTLFNSITGDLSALGVDQLSAADAQESELQEIKDLIDESGDTLFDLNAAVQEFKDAKESLNEAAWMQTELDTLSSIDDNISLLYAAASAYYDSIGQDVPDYAKPRGSGAGLLSDVTSASGIQLNDLIFNTLATKIQQLMDNDTYSDLAASTAIFGFSSSFRNSMDMEDLLSKVGNYSDDYSFADGGIISGPSSGYQMPNTIFHGTEAIIPLTGGSIPIEIKNGEQNITVVVKVGNRELKDITTEIIRTDAEAQKQIRRVANG